MDHLGSVTISISSDGGIEELRLLCDTEEKQEALLKWLVERGIGSKVEG